MYTSALYADAQKTLETCLGLRQLFVILPPNAELSIFLDERIYATLTCHEQHLKLAPRQSSHADIEIILFPESIRRLKDHAPDDVMALVRSFAEFAAVGHAKIKLLVPVRTLYTKGYLEALKGYGPEFQRELSKYSFLLLGKIGQLSQSIKDLLKR